MSVDDYIRVDQENLDSIRTVVPHFRDLIPSINDLYDIPRPLIPKSGSFVLVFGRSFLLCHKSFLSAAVTIGRRHPDDAAAITRRAIEIASTALAVKHDPENLERWKSVEKRLARWEARSQGVKPKTFSSEITYPPSHPALEVLRRYQGVLSDAFVHFTPELVAGQGWRHKTREESGWVELPYLEVNQRVIEGQLLILGGIHVRILEIFDECLDGAFSKSEQWRAQKADIEARGAALGQLFLSPPVQPEEEEG